MSIIETHVDLAKNNKQYDCNVPGAPTAACGLKTEGRTTTSRTTAAAAASSTITKSTMYIILIVDDFMSPITATELLYNAELDIDIVELEVC